ncbi:MAG TPA: alcohol dehydrogenase catalytic domain-containing protein [Candidatus Limnocylindria bacterium]
MRAVRLHAPGEALRLEDVPLPEPFGTEVRIRVAGAGVCHTDLHIVDGIQTRVELPRTLGHEVAGRIDAVAPSASTPLRRARLKINDPVVVFGGWGCGECLQCRSGDEQRCPDSLAPGFQADGGYAEAMLVPHPRHLVALGDLEPARAAPLADAGITPFNAIRRALPWLRPGSRVLVIGAGALGQFALQLLRLAVPNGRELVVGVRELDPGRLERAAELGADVGLLAVEPELTIEGLGGRPDVVLDFVGTDGTLAHATDVVTPGGAILLVGEAGGEIPFGMDRLTAEAWLTTVSWGSPADLREVVRLARRGRLVWNVELLPLEGASIAHDRLRAGDVGGRIVLVP